MSIKEQESTSCALDLPIDDTEWALATRRQAAAEASHQCVGVPCLSYTLIHLIQLARRSTWY